MKEFSERLKKRVKIKIAEANEKKKSYLKKLKKEQDKKTEHHNNLVHAQKNGEGFKPGTIVKPNPKHKNIIPEGKTNETKGD